MKPKILQDYSHGISEVQASFNLEPSTNQPVGHPEARGESGANAGVNLNVI
jgi:hypothetical protein